ncbi:MAG: carboxypeptidase-like regulatory domain-containing protein [Armatimonadota bacterium]|nr:carboxypeptidase-like regulatory domain-containing protein [bacterium]
MRHIKETFTRYWSNQRNTAFALIFTSMALLLISGISSFAGNLIPDPMLNSFAPGTATISEGDYNYSSWRYYSVGGALGTLAAVTPGRDGTGVAVKLSQAAPSGTGSTGFDLNNHRVVLQPGHRYRLQVWARSDSAIALWLACPVFDSATDYNNMVDARGAFATTSTWAPYTLLFTATSTSYYADPTVTIVDPGSVVVDDITIQDITNITGELIPDSQINCIPPGTAVGEGGYGWGIWRYFSVGEAGGTLNTVSPGRDGTGQALKLARTTNWGTGDTGFDIWNCPVALQGGHSYRIKLWGRSDDGDWIQVQAMAYGPDMAAINNYFQNFFMPTTWAPNEMEIAVTADTRLELAIRPIYAGSVVIDDISVEDVTSIPDLALDTKLDGLTGVATTAEGGYQFGAWRYYSVGGANGTLTAVSPGRDGTGVAVKLARADAPAGSDTALDTWFNKIHLIANHRYRATAWARSDEGTPFWVQCPQFDAAGTWLSDIDVRTQYGTLPTWAAYVVNFMAPAYDTYFDPSLGITQVGNVLVDDFSVQDMTTAVDGLIPDTKLDTFAGVSTTTEGIYQYGTWRYYSVGGANGTLTSVSPGRDGTGVAIKLSQGGDLGVGGTALDMDTYRIPVQSGHRYRLQVWARSDSGIPFFIACPQYDSADPTTHVYNDARGEFVTTSTWAPYVLGFTAIDGFAYAGPTLTIVNPGNVEFDDFTMQDVSSITGTVTNSLSLQPIAGAVVTVKSGDASFSTTTDASGVYTVDVLRSTDYIQTVSAAGYEIYKAAGNGVAGSATTDLQLVPASGQTWSISDTFTRDKNSDLGNTEDANAVPWIKATTNTASEIDNGALLMSDTNASSLMIENTAVLGRVLPADVDMTVEMTWLDLIDSLYSRIGYRSTSIGTSGYFVNCPWQGDGIELWFQNVMLARTSVSTNWVGTTIRVKATGNHHQVWLDNQLVIDVVDNCYLGGGPAYLIGDAYNIVQWDNFNVSPVASIPTPTMGSTATAKSQENGTVVGVAGAVVTGAYNGFFYIEDTNRTSGIKVVSNTAVSVNQLVDVIGTIDTQDGEKFIAASKVDPKTGTFDITPLGMNNKALGTQLPSGLLVKVWGKVAPTSGNGYLYIDDGSGLVDASGNAGIRVDLSQVTVRPNAGTTIDVTGVAGITVDGGNAVLVIRPRTNQDIH